MESQPVAEERQCQGAANEVRRVGLDGKGYEPLLKNVTYPISIGLYLCP